MSSVAQIIFFWIILSINSNSLLAKNKIPSKSNSLKSSKNKNAGRGLSSTQSLDFFAKDSKKKTIETQLGNLLLSQSNNVIISIPIKIQKSTLHPFGDGQSNSRLSFGDFWKHNEFPVIGILKKNGQAQAKPLYIFHESLKISEFKETPLNNGWIQVTPKGWIDSFYFNFNPSTIEISEFLKGIPETFRTLSQNRTAPNPEKISRSESFQTLSKHTWGEGYNTAPFIAENVHGLYPNSDGSKSLTAVGGVSTWGVFEKKFSPYKHLYTCFDARNLNEENKHGVPTGAGWHQIGDPAETILNTIESQPIPVAVARENKFSNSAFELTETITATWLRSEEALVTIKNDFHWYVNPYEKNICTEIWVHNCVPNISNNWGFNCQ